MAPMHNHASMKHIRISAIKCYLEFTTEIIYIYTTYYILGSGSSI